MLKTVALVLIALWVIGLVADVAGGLIHLALIAALVVFIYDMLAGRKRAHL